MNDPRHLAARLDGFHRRMVAEAHRRVIRRRVAVAAAFAASVAVAVGLL